MRKSSGNFRISVHGVSMLPMIKSEDTLTFIKPDKYRIGDIVVFERQRGSVIAHRVLCRSKNHAYIKGDATVAIEKVPLSSVMGLVTSVTGNSSTHIIERGLYLYPVSILSFFMHRVWKRTGEFKKAVNSLPSRILQKILRKHM